MLVAPSGFVPAGVEAATILHLFWIMAGGAVLVWVVVLGIALYAARGRTGSVRLARWLIIGGGVVAPTLLLGGLLLYGLSLMPRLRAPVSADGLHISVTGEQWWWRVAYFPHDVASATATGIRLANEIRLPVGERVEFTLSSPDVIHSFWVPALGGKMDMIPGRTTTLALQPTRTGVFDGACAEYCGASHAFMRFPVVVMERDDFAHWLQRQALPAQAPRSALAAHGRDAFLRNGCGACHAIRGTPAAGVVGPDLTHVGSRLSLAAGTLPNDVEAYRRWIATTHAVKPEATMPAFGMLPEPDLLAIATYLDGLQ